MDHNTRNANPSRTGGVSTLGMLLRIAVIVSVIEAAIMVVLSLGFNDSLHDIPLVLLDACLLALISLPLIYFLVVRPFVLASDEVLNVTRQLAMFDPLTQLPNRRQFEIYLTQALSLARRTGRAGAIVYLDLDGFKTVNDVHSHEIGDAVLVETANRLRQTNRMEDVVCRLGGDEFVLLVQDLGDNADDARSAVRSLAERMERGIAQTIDVHNVELNLNCSIGIRLFGKRAVRPEVVLREADLAMYRAKRSSRTNIVFADELDLDWYGTVRLGLPDIDRQHQNIDELLEDASRTMSGKVEYLRKVLSALQEHLDSEVRLSRQFKLDMTQEHKLEHNRLKSVLKDIGQQLSDNTVEEDMRKIKRLLKEHVMVYDSTLVHR